jgi:hypothetical protein
LIVVGLIGRLELQKNIILRAYLDLFGLDILKVVFSATQGELDGPEGKGMCGYLIGKF